jgi:hypothetical protein
MFLLTVIAGSLVQAFVAAAVLRPLEAREARARAELVLSNVAAEIAVLPGSPSEAAVDTILVRHRPQLGHRGRWLVFRGQDGVLAADPPALPHLRAALAGDENQPDTTGGGKQSGPVRRFETIASRPVVRGAQPIGEVLVMRPMWSRGTRGLLSRTPLLFVPSR